MTDITSSPSHSVRRLSGTRLTGAILLALLAAFAILGPVLIPFDPARQDFSASLAPIGGEHILGADQYGRSLLARLAHGARLSFGMSFLTMLAAAVPGVLFGLIAAWRGGWTEPAEGDAHHVLLPGVLLQNPRHLPGAAAVTRPPADDPCPGEIAAAPLELRHRVQQ
jgi:peptide/nickel transport system permease protein